MKRASEPMLEVLRAIAGELRTVRQSLERIESIVEDACVEDAVENEEAAVMPGQEAEEMAAAQWLSSGAAGRVPSQRDAEEEAEDVAGLSPLDSSYDPFAGLMGTTSAPAPARSETRFVPDAASDPFVPSGLPDPFADLGLDASASGNASDLSDHAPRIDASVKPTDDELMQLLGSVSSDVGANGAPRASGPSPRPSSAAKPPARGERNGEDARAVDADKFDMSTDDLESIFGWKS